MSTSTLCPFCKEFPAHPDTLDGWCGNCDPNAIAIELDGHGEVGIIEPIVDGAPALILTDEGDADIVIVPPPTNPRAVAAQWMARFHTDDVGAYLLRRHRAIFWRYDGTAWLELEDARLESELYAYLATAVYDHPKEGLKPWEPTDKKIRDVTKALGALVYLDGAITPPAWIDGDGPDVVPVNNGLLDLKTRQLHPHTPAYFSTHHLSFEYDATAPAPERWMAFLEELWPDDPSSIEALQEVMGYILGDETRLQKIFALIGPKRGGKGTIGRVLSGLLGDHNVAAPTLASLATQFGMWPLIGKPLALVSDARISARVDSPIAVERLLTVSGEDSITVDRKYKEPVTGRLPTRFVIMTNEIPKFADSSGALASRFILLVLTKSFYGREDPMLTEKRPCPFCGGVMLAWMKLDLDHTFGAIAHAACNRSHGARFGNALRGLRRRYSSIYYQGGKR